MSRSSPESLRDMETKQFREDVRSTLLRSCAAKRIQWDLGKSEDVVIPAPAAPTVVSFQRLGTRQWHSSQTMLKGSLGPRERVCRMLKGDALLFLFLLTAVLCAKFQHILPAFFSFLHCVFPILVGEGPRRPSPWLLPSFPVQPSITLTRSSLARHSVPASLATPTATHCNCSCNCHCPHTSHQAAHCTPFHLYLQPHPHPQPQHQPQAGITRSTTQHRTTPHSAAPHNATQDPRYPHTDISTQSPVLDPPSRATLPSCLPPSPPLVDRSRSLSTTSRSKPQAFGSCALVSPFSDTITPDLFQNRLVPVSKIRLDIVLAIRKPPRI